MLQLVLPQEQYWASFQKGLSEVKDNPSPYDIGAITKAFSFSNFSEYQQYCEKTRMGIGLKPGYVPSTYLWLIQDDEFVGIFDIRHSLTETLKAKGGHIAYLIIPSKRRLGFAVQGLKLCCLYANYNLSLKEVLVCCNENNIASYKTMTKVMQEYGGFEDVPTSMGDHLEKRVWINTVINL